MLDSRIPGFAGADRRGRWKIVAATVAFALVTSVLTSYFQFGFNLLTMSATARAEDSAGGAIEAGKEPFTTAVTSSDDADSVLRDNRLDAQWIVFDEPLTPAEQTAVVTHPLGTETTIPEFLSMLNGFAHKPHLVYPGDGGRQDNGASPRAAFPYKLTLQSDRSHAVSVRGMDATDVHCSDSSAPTVIHLPPEGGEEVDNVAVDLADGVAPLLRQSRDGTYPYFSRGYIELGNGQTSWAANLDVLTGARACTWSFQVSYVSEGVQYTKSIRSPRFRTTGLPARPAQLIEFRPDGVGNGWRCWGERIAPETLCTERAAADDPSVGETTLRYWGSRRGMP
ncbi:hypothetical protein ACIRF8_14780 [Streptomyces sp. NPDC102406]|uniref:hypothetical protein n=1 Tax=Streptomyces sp. NPDC102406 TaxID=3366171 RepID=UPI0038195D5B